MTINALDTLPVDDSKDQIEKLNWKKISLIVLGILLLCALLFFNTLWIFHPWVNNSGTNKTTNHPYFFVDEYK